MKKILFIYPSMLIGGSTTALLSLLKCLPPEKYDVDLQLFRNEGLLLDAIPAHVNLLPQAEIYTGKKGRLIKNLKFVFGLHIFRAIVFGLTGNKKKFFSRSALVDFQSKTLSRKNPKEYDYAIGYLEGWSNRYLAFSVKANRKYAWLHSTFKNITSEPQEELAWMRKVDKIVFVADQPCDAFKAELPEMAYKAITIENITDSDSIKKRSLAVDTADDAYNHFVSDKRFKLVTVCRLTISVKGLDRIVNCAKHLMEEGKDFLWYIIGDGEDKTTLFNLIEAAGVADCVIPIGKRMNPYPFIAAADMMCMPSRFEGKPMTITESLILGVPPIVTSYLSANDQIRNGVDGIVVDNGDDTIIPVLQDCLEKKEKVASMRKNAEVTEYGNSAYIEEFEEIIFNGC